MAEHVGKYAECRINFSAERAARGGLRGTRRSRGGERVREAEGRGRRGKKKEGRGCRGANREEGTASASRPYRHR